MLTIDIPEQLDLQTTPDFMRSVQGQLDQHDVLIQLGQLQKIDSAGIAALLELIKQSNQGEQSIQFSPIPANLKKLLNLYGVAELFEEASAV